MVTENRNFSDIINAELERQELNKHWLANQTAIPYRTIWRKLHGDGTNFTLHEVLTILKALKLNFPKIAKELTSTPALADPYERPEQ